MRALLGLLILSMTSACTHQPSGDSDALRAFAERYTEAWCSQNAASVAEFFAPGATLTINGGTPAAGRDAITADAQAFMTAFPDMVVSMDALEQSGGHAVYHWTLTGTDSGPGGSGNAVQLRGYEEWTIGADGLISASQGHFDEAEYQRQLSR